MPDATEDTTTAGAARVHWRRDGSGPPIVFLPGFPLSGRTWDAVVARLRDRFTCVALDLIGLGHRAVTRRRTTPRPDRPALSSVC